MFRAIRRQTIREAAFVPGFCDPSSCSHIGQAMVVRDDQRLVQKKADTKPHSACWVLLTALWIQEKTNLLLVLFKHLVLVFMAWYYVLSHLACSSSRTNVRSQTADSHFLPRSTLPLLTGKLR